MTRTLPLILLLVGCGGGPDLGTQIGVEHSDCEILSQEDWTDGATVPDGFEQSLDEVLARVEGTFEGSDTVDGGLLSLEATAGAATLERREASEISTEFEAVCPDQWVVAFELELTHSEGTWTGPAEVHIDEDERITVRAVVTDAASFPGPTTFDRDADFTWFSLDLEVTANGWDLEGIWHFENAESDGRGEDAYQTETVLAARLQ